MRGRTLTDAFVILDEPQNTTSEQMKSSCPPRVRLEGGDHRRRHPESICRPADLWLNEAMKVCGHIDGIAFVHSTTRTSCGIRSSQMSRRTSLQWTPIVITVTVTDGGRSRRRARPARWLTKSHPQSPARLVAIALVTDARIRALNSIRRKDAATYVLSANPPTSSRHGRARRQARASGIPTPTSSRSWRSTACST